MHGAHYFFLAAVVVSVVAGVHDWRTGHIPNWLTFGALIIAPLAHAAFGYGREGSAGAIDGLKFSLIGAVACGAVPLLLYRVGGMFGGDLKLLVAVGAILRTMVGIEAEFYAFIAAALFALGRLSYEGSLLKTVGNSMMLIANPFLPKNKKRKVSQEMMTTMRFGPAAAVGVCLAVFLNWSGN